MHSLYQIYLFDSGKTQIAAQNLQAVTTSRCPLRSTHDAEVSSKEETSGVTARKFWTLDIGRSSISAFVLVEKLASREDVSRA